MPIETESERYVNMYDVKRKIKVKSAEWKIGKTAQERVGHLMRMENERLTKGQRWCWDGRKS